LLHHIFTHGTLLCIKDYHVRKCNIY